MTKTTQLKRDEVISNFSGKDDYDLVIIGAGLSGLSSGLMWLKNTVGKKNLIIEKKIVIRVDTVQPMSGMDM